jgi:hypothetical protein
MEPTNMMGPPKPSSRFTGPLSDRSSCQPYRRATTFTIIGPVSAISSGMRQAGWRSIQ